MQSNNIDDLIEIVGSNDPKAIAAYIKENDLVLTDDNKLVPKSGSFSQEYAFWDKRQLVKKILLNSLYGALLNQHSRFFDFRLGQSTTLTGRCIARHMAAQTNEAITGTYDHTGDTIVYGDSVTGDSMIRTSEGHMPISELFEKIEYKVLTDQGEGDHYKEYAIPTAAEPYGIQVMGYNAFEDTADLNNISYVMRHKTKKQLYEIETEDGRVVTVTEDHSIIVDRHGFTEEIKPADLREDDMLITIDWPSNGKGNNLDTGRQAIKRITKLEPTEEYVYDISIENMDPFFFANDILVHNTDSVYFSAYPAFKSQIDSGEFKWDKDTIVTLYDAIGEQVNDTFPAYMARAHNCPSSHGRIIAAAREVIGETGLFISKKRYGILVFDDEGTRLDTNDSRGKLKVLGLEIKRSDTPAYMQDFLKRMLSFVLEGGDEQQGLDMIIQFRREFREKNPWDKGTPKRVNNLTKHTAKFKKTGKCSVGHALAAIQYNRLRDMYGDQYSMEVTDGMKTIVCRLKANPMGIKSIGIPTDEKRVPEWFKKLPFDDQEMEYTTITKKINNLLGNLDWDLGLAEDNSTFNDLFSYDD